MGLFDIRLQNYKKSKKMANSLLFTSLSLSLAFFLSLTSLNFSASEHLSSSLTIASDQLNLWSQNVQNKMPNSIVKKLSPMSKKDCNYYSNIMSENGKFSADSNFCALAKLACDSTLSVLKTVENTYTTKKTYNINSAPFKQENNAKQDPFSFFRLEKLKTGNLVHLPDLKESLPERSFLPDQIASRIPLNSEAISKTFPDITTVKAVKETVETSLSYCNAGAIKGETMSCPKSLGDLIGFAKSTLGGSKLISLTSTSTQGSNSELIVRNVKKFNAKKIVACHEAFLPFAAYFCHSLAKTQLYEVDFVEPKNGRPVNTMLAICHMDTSPWPKDHVAFEILKFGPGQGEACHWFTQLDLAWIST